MYKYMSYELKDKMDGAAGVFYKGPTIPDEVMKYREPVDPRRTSCRTDSGETEQHLSVHPEETGGTRSTRSEANLERLRKKKSVFPKKCSK